MTNGWTAEAMEARIVRYGDLRPCYNAFIDTRTPGSEAKENFTIIGPGVSENPNQYVHIAEPHGFNIGGARQPPGCVNSQHSHDTAEVFIAHTGRWRFDLGEHGEDAQVEMGPGDVISLPTRTFRGFTNIGEEAGFLFAVLGQDDPGRVTWAPRVFEMARDYGLVLLENGRLVDTKAGEAPPPGVAPMRPTGAEEVALLDRVAQADAERLVVHAGDGPQAGDMRVIGPDAPLGWPHGFTVTRTVLGAAEARSATAAGGAQQVLFVHRGRIEIGWGEERVTLGEGDTITLPPGLAATIAAPAGAIYFSVQRD